ncbi:unnamed protein product [Blepharisma stoltei]|uniref:BTB domain-containing protein n=1 Tax=Blepharisma stoltei TaxID=1481888 RepID=A0AAU9KBP9_9CILI|nr:unnamed protein product [Blepharisma stoltei]
MSNTSFEATLKIRTSPIEQLSDTDTCIRFTLDFLQRINLARKSQGNPLLYLDENCCSACSESMIRLGNLDTLLLASNVVGTDFKHIALDGTFDVAMSHNINRAVYDNFNRLVETIDQNSQRILNDPYFTHIGIYAKRSYSCFKLVIVVFKNDVWIHHAKHDIEEGYHITGKLLNHQVILCCLIIKDLKEGSKPTLAGPKRIKYNYDTLEFEFTIPRVIIAQRSLGERNLEFYACQDQRQINYGQGQDLQQIPDGLIPLHKMAFSGLWESNIMFELRNPEDSVFVLNEYESKSQKNVMVFSGNDFKKSALVTGRGRGRGITRQTVGIRNSWGRGAGTPFKGIDTNLPSVPELPSGNMDRNDSYSRTAGGYGNTGNGYSSSGYGNTGSSYGNRQVSTNSWENQPIASSGSYMSISSTNSYNRNKENSYSNNRAPNDPILPSASRPENRDVPQVFNFGDNPFSTQNSVSNPFSLSNPFSQTSNHNYRSSAPMVNSSTPYSQPISNQIISTPTNPLSSYSISQPQAYINNYQPQFPIQTNPIISPIQNQTPMYQQPTLYAYPQQIITQQLPQQYMPQFPQSPGPNFYQPNQFFSSQRIVQPGCHFASPQLAHMINNIPPGTPNVFQNPGQPTQVFSASNILQNGFGQPSAQGIFGNSQKSSLGSTFNKPLDKLNQQLKAISQKPKEIENIENPDLVNIPALILPIPKGLLEDIRKIQPENTSYKTLYQTMEYSDVLIRVKETDIKAHKAVLYSASPFFRDYLDRLKGIPSSIHVAKIIMPTWFSVEPFKIVLKFMYSCDIEKELINLATAKEILQIADHLDLIELVRVIIVKFVIVQLTKDDVLGLLQLAGSRGKDTKDEAWDYLMDSCAMFAAQHSNWLVRNRRAECLGLPLSSLMRMIEFAMGCCVSKEHIALVLKLLTDIRYADDIFALATKISALYMIGYTDSTLDIRMVDFVKPFTKEQLGKLDESMAMEYAILEENAPYYLTFVRHTPVPPPQLPESINLINAPSSNPLSVQPSSSYQNLPPQMNKEPTKITSSYTQNIAPIATCIFDPKNLRARKTPIFSFSVPEINRSRNVMSRCFTFANRKWSVLVSTCPDGFTSLFLCERGPADTESKFMSLLFTSVLFELEIDDQALRETNRVGNQSMASCCFYSFPNDHYHIAGERKYCKTSTLKNQESAIVNVYMRIAGIHSGIMHYLTENFSTLIVKDYKSFRDMSFYNMKYILSHDALAVKDEHEAAGALWKYAASREPEVINIMVPEIRYQFLSMKDLLTLARDHRAIRNAANFGYIFKQEYYRRTAGKPITEKPRNNYVNTLEDFMKIDHNESIIDWILHSNHHEGYEDKLAQVKKQYEEEKAMNDKRRAELNAKKHELYIENDKLAQELRKTRVEERRIGHVINDLPKAEVDLRSSRQNYEIYDAGRSECAIM